jgi:hypothetical protein
METPQGANWRACNEKEKVNKNNIYIVKKKVKVSIIA